MQDFRNTLPPRHEMSFPNRGDPQQSRSEEGSPNRMRADPDFDRPWWNWGRRAAPTPRRSYQGDANGDANASVDDASRSSASQTSPSSRLDSRAFSPICREIELVGASASRPSSPRATSGERISTEVSRISLKELQEPLLETVSEDHQRGEGLATRPSFCYWSSIRRFLLRSVCCLVVSYAIFVSVCLTWFAVGTVHLYQNVIILDGERRQALFEEGKRTLRERYPHRNLTEESFKGRIHCCSYIVRLY